MKNVNLCEKVTNNTRPATAKGNLVRPGFEQGLVTSSKSDENEKQSRKSSNTSDSREDVSATTLTAKDWAVVSGSENTRGYDPIIVDMRQDRVR